jgi:hypothetical protein
LNSNDFVEPIPKPKDTHRTSALTSTYSSSRVAKVREVGIPEDERDLTQSALHLDVVDDASSILESAHVLQVHTTSTKPELIGPSDDMMVVVADDDDDDLYTEAAPSAPRASSNYPFLSIYPKLAESTPSNFEQHRSITMHNDDYIQDQPTPSHTKQDSTNPLLSSFPDELAEVDIDIG